MMKKKYVTPTIKAVEWNFQQPICNAVYQQSPCVHVIGDEGGATHIDHRGTWRDGEINWNTWNE